LNSSALDHAKHRLQRSWWHFGGAGKAVFAAETRKQMRGTAAELERLKDRGHRTIAFGFAFDYMLDTFDPVYRELLRDERIIVYFACSASKPELRAALLERYDQPLIVDDRLLSLLPLDAFISAELCPSSMPLRSSTRTIQMYHGTGVGFLSNFMPWLEAFDAHLAPGPQFVELIEREIRPKKPRVNVYPIGFPKTDSLVTGTEGAGGVGGVGRTSVSKELRTKYVRQGMKTILYAPHFSPFGSLKHHGETMISTLASTGAHLLVKVHGYGLQARQPVDSHVEFFRSLERLERQGSNISIVSHSNTQDLYPLADVVITDAMSSVAAESCLCQRPLVAYRLCDEDPIVGRRCVEKELEDLAFSFSNPEQAHRLVTRLLSPDDATQKLLEQQRNQQKLFVSRHFFNPGNATRSAVDAIRAELQLETQDQGLP
jgi:hypothetical protein